MRKLKGLSSIVEKSELMKVSLELGDEKYIFNLYEELSIREFHISDELKEQAKNYAFLGMLHKKLIKIVKDQKIQLDKKFGEIYIKYKSQPGEGSRAKSKDLAIAETEKDKIYLMALKKYHTAEHNKDIIEICVRAFEQKKDLIQTLSANVRKEVS